MSEPGNNQNMFSHGTDTDQWKTLQSRQTIFCNNLLCIVGVDWTYRKQGNNRSIFKLLYCTRTWLRRHRSLSGRGRNEKVKIIEAYGLRDAQRRMSYRTKNLTIQKQIRKVTLRYFNIQSAKTRCIAIISMPDKTSFQYTNPLKYETCRWLDEKRSALHISHQWRCPGCGSDPYWWPDGLTTALPQPDQQSARDFHQQSKDILQRAKYARILYLLSHHPDFPLKLPASPQPRRIPSITAQPEQ